MRAFKRAVHIDFHTLPGIYNFNEGWDAEKFAEILSDAKVEYINAFARCNIGFAYYPTKVGMPYPGMKGDMLGDTLRECHKRNIGVSAYFNIGIDQSHAALHPDWLQIDKDGHVLSGDRLGNFFRMLCYNNPDYNEYHFAMLREVCEYDVDGIFFDCLVIRPCYCIHCQEKMRALGIDPNDEAANMRFQEQSLISFCEKSKRIVGDKRYFYLNGLHYSHCQNLNTHIEVECLPCGKWGYDYFWSRASYARKLKERVVYMTGRFQRNWGDFGGFKTKESMQNDYYDALCAGVGVSVGDHMHPARNLEPDVYKAIGEINEFIVKVEPYTEKAKYLADIGVMINSERELPTENGIWENGTYMPHGYQGVTRMLGELKESYDIIDETMELTPYRLIILPDSVRMNEPLKSKLAAYLKNGGKVLSTGTSGINRDLKGFALPQWDFEFDGIDPCNATYYSFVKNDDPKVCNMQYRTYSEHDVLIKSKRPIAKHVKSYFNYAWDGIHGYSYTPPEKETGYATAAVNSDGSVCHIAFDIFNAYYRSAAYAQKALVKQCLELLLPEPLIRTEGLPSSARATLTGCEEFRLLHVKVTHPELRGEINMIEEHDILSAGASVYVKGSCKNACCLPDKTPVVTEPSEKYPGYTRVVLPKIVGYQMIYLENA